MDLMKIRGIGSSYKKKLNMAGIDTLEKMAICNVEEVAEKSKISIKKLIKWKEEARKIVGEAKAIIIDDIPKISMIEIEDGKAKVKIKEWWHDAKIFDGEAKKMAEGEKIAVLLGRKPKLWFNGKWYENIPYKRKRRWIK